MGLKKAIIKAGQGNVRTEIWTGNLLSVIAILDPQTPHQLLRDIQSLLTQNRNILVRCIKAHVGYRGNEEPDTLSKNATTKGVVVNELKPKALMRT
ncbi:hypothetical protein AVEN_168126-1 [Araneus ventricosus]|uniref:Uncharacterized protein n=1 Tax=Araneus ventricosus TaxID=182803 RepID=A0A4Y2PVZ5_ARAVE|nr:hypothetical protein AVEN_168126-1 [Araneus ventricosus]